MSARGSSIRNPYGSARAARRSVRAATVGRRGGLATLTVEIVSFAGCPNAEPARETVERIVGELGLDAEIVTVDVPDLDAAQRIRFLGSPTVRVDGVDVEPGADRRTDYVVGCRIFRTTDGVRGQPDERWIREALLEAAGR